MAFLDRVVRLGLAEGIVSKLRGIVRVINLFKLDVLLLLFDPRVVGLCDLVVDSVESDRRRTLTQTNITVVLDHI